MCSSEGGFAGVYQWDEKRNRYFPVKNVLGDMMEYLRIENDFSQNFTQCGNTWEV